MMISPFSHLQNTRIFNPHPLKKTNEEAQFHFNPIRHHRCLVRPNHLHPSRRSHFLMTRFHTHTHPSHLIVKFENLWRLLGGCFLGFRFYAHGLLQWRVERLFWLFSPAGRIALLMTLLWLYKRARNRRLRQSTEELKMMIKEKDEVCQFLISKCLWKCLLEFEHTPVFCKWVLEKIITLHYTTMRFQIHNNENLTYHLKKITWYWVWLFKLYVKVGHDCMWGVSEVVKLLSFLALLCSFLLLAGPPHSQFSYL